MLKKGGLTEEKIMEILVDYYDNHLMPFLTRLKSSTKEDNGKELLRMRLDESLDVVGHIYIPIIC